MAKTNPRNIPRTQADVEKADKVGYAAGQDKGYEDGCNLALQMTLWIFCEKYNASQEDLDRYSADFKELCEHISEGRISALDIASALTEEHDCEINYI